MSDRASVAENRLRFSILSYLDSVKNEKLTETQIGALNDAISSLESVFSLSATSQTDANALSVNANLSEIFSLGTSSVSTLASPDSAFERLITNVTSKGYFNASPTDQTQVDGEERQKRLDVLKTRFDEKLEKTEAERLPKAEEAKSKGNAFLKNKQYAEAVDMYDLAISTSPHGSKTHIYYCNRAAARAALGDWRASLEDAERSVVLKPSYAKAHYRKAFALEHLKRKPDASKAYARVVELDPSHQGAQDAVNRLSSSSSKKKSNSSTMTPSAAAAAAPSAANPFGGAPSGGGAPAGLGGLMESMMGGLGGAGAGADGGLAGLMNNPELMKMASEMAKDPNAQAQMNQMMQSMMGGNR